MRGVRSKRSSFWGSAPPQSSLATGLGVSMGESPESWDTASLILRSSESGYLKCDRHTNKICLYIQNHDFDDKNVQLNLNGN